ncbi:hypothetical protein VTO42DRAFT_310 [Malbranchea cinnamomea]
MPLQCHYNSVALHASTPGLIHSAENIVQYGKPIPSHAWSLPAQALPSRSKIPSPTLFKGLSDLPTFPVSAASASESFRLGLPSVAECAVHLELLQTFYYLRRNVLESTDLDNRWEIELSQSRWAMHRDSTFAIKRREKWNFFLKLASLRFMDWLKSTDQRLSKLPPELWTIGVPPLDILLVWHSFLLDPQRFEDFCNQHGYTCIRDVKFPWKAIHETIDRNNWTFSLQDDNPAPADSLKTKDLFGFLCRTDRENLVHAIMTDLLPAGLSDREIGRVIGRTEHLKVTYDYFLNNLCKGADTAKITTANNIVAAIERQNIFVDKMEKQLWICSPAVAATLQRAIQRYIKFITLLKLYPDQTLAPAVDIDLVWHTHQCSASRYQADMRTLAGRFVDHNNNLGISALDTAMERTAQLWQMRFGQEYDVCHCWDCEALLSAAIEVEEHQQGKGKCSTESVNTDTIAQTVADYVTYYRYMEVSRRLDKPLP